MSESLFPYDVRDVVIDPDHHGGWRYRYDPEAVSHRATTYPSKQELLDVLRRYGALAELPYRVDFGCVLTGSARIRARSYRDELVRWCADVAPNIAGGEMEGLGLLSLAERESPHWIVVKGVCDYADETQIGDAKANRRQACANAASFGLRALRSWNPPVTEV